MSNWKLKNKKTGAVLKRTFTTRDEARNFAWNRLDNNYQSIYMVFKPSNTKTTATKSKGSMTTMNTKPILKKIKFGTPVHKAKPVHRSY